MYTKDPVVISVVWGRLGAAILALVAFLLGIFGYTLAPDDQASLSEVIGALLAGVASVLAIASKVRESKKAK